MEFVYLLRDDHESVNTMRSGSLALGTQGLHPTHGPIGSAEWWENFDSGKLALGRRKGKVSGFWPGQGGGGPAEFELLSSEGATSKWLCNVEPDRARREFFIGRKVELTYVEQELKVSYEGITATRVTLSIALE